MVTRRDFVHKRKLWKNEDSKLSTYMLYSASTETPLFPPRKGFIRGHTYISGFYVEQISVNPPKVKFMSISQNDLSVTA